MITKLIIPVINTDGQNFDYNDSYDNMQMHINVRKPTEDVDIKYEYCEAEALIKDSNRNDINEDFFYSKLDNNKMFILIVNINPISLEPDAESELKSWIDESNMVLSNAKLDNQMKIKALPTMTIKILLNDTKYTLNNCKMFEDYSDRKFPLYFAMLVEKIID